MVTRQITYQKRTYRKYAVSERFASFAVSYKETDFFISVDKASYKAKMQAFILKRILFYRKEIESFAARHPLFYKSLKPMYYYESMPHITAEMLKASETAGTGPMSAVAGAFSEHIGRDLLNRYDIKELLIENGGDIFMKITSPVTISIFAGSSVFSEKIGLRIPENATPLGVCTSAGTVGHSLSFGKADALVIACKNTLLADAFATKFANMIKKKTDINRIIEEIQKEKSILSSVIIKDETIGIFGKYELIYLNKQEYEKVD